VSVITCFLCLGAYLTENPHDSQGNYVRYSGTDFVYKVLYRELSNNCYNSNKESYQTKSDVNKLVLAIIYEVRKESLMWRPHPFIYLSDGQRLCVTDQFICRFFFCEIWYKNTLHRLFEQNELI